MLNCTCQTYWLCNSCYLFGILIPFVLIATRSADSLGEIWTSCLAFSICFTLFHFIGTHTLSSKHKKIYIFKGFSVFKPRLMISRNPWQRKQMEEGAHGGCKKQKILRIQLERKIQYEEKYRSTKKPIWSYKHKQNLMTILKTRKDIYSKWILETIPCHKRKI